MGDPVEEEEVVEESEELGFSVTRHSQALLSAAGMCHRMDSGPPSRIPLWISREYFPYLCREEIGN